MTISIPAPLFTQLADEEMLLAIAEVIRPGCLTRRPSENGLRINAPGDPLSHIDVSAAADEFQILLGVLRAWRPSAGQRQDEQNPGMGPGPVRDEHGNQFSPMGCALSYPTSNGEIVDYATTARAALENSRLIRNALWLNGRRDRSAADAYMIYEYARQEFCGDEAASLGISPGDIKNLTQSANNLVPQHGGRHATGRVQAKWSLPQILTFTGQLLAAWMEKLRTSMG